MFRSALIFIVVATASAANWPAWRGPEANGASPDKAPTHWTKTENVRWRVALPEPGNSTPVVWGDRIFITQPIKKDGRRTLMCFDRASGKLLWQSGVTYTEADPTHSTNPYASPSPATDGRVVIAWFGSAGLLAYDVNGKEVWRRDLGKQKHTWGYASSPVIHGDRVFLNFGPGERSFLIALDKNSGKTIWQNEIPAGQGMKFSNWDPADMYGSWSTPLIIKTAGREELIVTLPRRVLGLDPATGKTLWTCDGMGDLVYPSPVFADGIVVAMGGFAGPSLAVRAGGSGDVTATHRLWRRERSRQMIGSGVVHQGRLYTVDTGGIVEAIDPKTGDSLWTGRLTPSGASGNVWSSFVLSDDKLYVMNQSGETFILKPGPAFEVIAKNNLEEASNSSVVISNGDVILRTHAALWSIGGAGPRAVLDDLERRARAALDRIPHVATRADAEKMRGPLRRRLEESLGFRRLPWPPDLRASVTGTIQREGYRIDKVIFQTLPGTWVPAHLYLPAAVESRVPAILFYNGHWWPDSKSRPDFQAFCINMARMGFAVLSFDPFGQGERGVSSRDHRRTETLLVGISQQGIAEYETRCALEYLLSRREVDPKRVGITGASGGGYNTWITAALEDRISVAVPVVGTSDFFEQIHVTRDLDWYAAAEHCHFVPGLIRYANNHELLAMAAPKPLMIIAASVDQSFPIGGVRAVYEYGKQLYGAFDMREKVGFFEDTKEGHGYQKAKREAAYGWFLRWLMNRGDGQPVPEPPTTTEPFDSAELRCFPDGRKEPAGPGMIEAVKRLAKTSNKAASIETIMGEPVEAAVEIPKLILRSEGAEAGVLVAVDDRGKEALAEDPIIREALKRNWTIWAIDPRGIGELKTGKQGWVFAVSLLLGENFVWRQGSDIRRMIDTAAADHRVALYARGHNAALAATYALAQGPAPQWAVLREGFTSYRQFFERPRSLKESYRLVSDDIREQRKTAFDREIPHEYVPFGALLSFDLPQLIARSKAKTFIIDPINGDWEPSRGTGTLDEFLKSNW